MEQEESEERRPSKRRIFIASVRRIFRFFASDFALAARFFVLPLLIVITFATIITLFENRIENAGSHQFPIRYARNLINEEIAQCGASEEPVFPRIDGCYVWSLLSTPINRKYAGHVKTPFCETSTIVCGIYSDSQFIDCIKDYAPLLVWNSSLVFDILGHVWYLVYSLGFAYASATYLWRKIKSLIVIASALSSATVFGMLMALFFLISVLTLYS